MWGTVRDLSVPGWVVIIFCPPLFLWLGFQAGKPMAYDTFIVILPITAVLFEWHATVFSVPAIRAPTLPETFVADTALAMSHAAVWAAFQRAVLAVPASDAQACTILALTMFVASREWWNWGWSNCSCAANKLCSLHTRHNFFPRPEKSVSCPSTAMV